MLKNASDFHKELLKKFPYHPTLKQSELFLLLVILFLIFLITFNLLFYFDYTFEMGIKTNRNFFYYFWDILNAIIIIRF